MAVGRWCPQGDSGHWGTVRVSLGQFLPRPHTDLVDVYVGFPVCKMGLIKTKPFGSFWVVVNT